MTFNMWIRSLALAAMTAIALHADAAEVPNAPAFWAWAATPPMGWNSYDAYGDTVTEKEVLANATYMKDHLLTHGWKYVVIDFRWYDPEPTGDDRTLTKKRMGAKLAADDFGRMMPAVNRFPSAADGKGFKPLADQIHTMGLKFGFHMMRGIPRQAVNAATAIADSAYTAADAGDPKNTCGWCPDMFGVRNNAAGQAWYDSMFALYAAWGLDYIKVDDLSNPYATGEIEMIRKAIDKCGRPIVFSTSPGPTSIPHAEHVRANANMWRISGDFWDNWKKLNEQFDLIAKWHDAGGPGHWPDADMIPFGRIAIRSKCGGEDHVTHFTQDEQTTLMTLWALGPSPLMLGGNLPDNDEGALALITNDEVISVDQDAVGKQGVRISHKDGGEVWIKELKDGTRAVGLFNRGAAEMKVTLSFADVKWTGKHAVRNVWSGKDLGELENEVSMTVPSHGAVMLRVK